MQIYGQQRGVGVGKPIQALYGIESLKGARASAYRHFFGRWLVVRDDNLIDVEGEVTPVHIRQLHKSGQLREMDASLGEDKFHKVMQFSVAIEAVDIPSILDKSSVPALFTAAAIEHDMSDDGFVYFSAERGLILPGSTVRSPVSFTMNNRQAALKKYGQIVDAWENEPEFVVARFVRRNEDEWKFEPGELRGSSLWSIVQGWVEDEDKRRKAEVEKLMKAPVDTMDDGTFASLFQKKMVQGS